MEAYGDNAEIIRILQGENSTYVIMDNEGTVEGKIFPESSGKWKLPDSIFYGTGREFQDVKINIDMSTIEILFPQNPSHRLLHNYHHSVLPVHTIPH